MFLWVLIRRTIALVIRIFLLNRWVTLGAAVVLLGIFVGYPTVTSLMSMGAAAQQARSAPVTVRDFGQSAPPAASVQTYIKGMVDFDASLMWQSMSNDSVTQMVSKGGSPEQLQQGLNNIRDSGASYEDVSYIGAYPLSNGGTYFFYVVSRRGFSAPNAIDQIYFVFTVGPDGKIASIE
jgi:hypothetical protein